MSGLAGIVSRWRVRAGYLVALMVLWFARPTPYSIALGSAIGLAGLWLRAYAAGYLHKQDVLAVTGPYAYTRNPLYLGSAILAVGAAIAARSFISGSILLVYFALVYSVVMRKEEEELRGHHGTAFDEYARAVPLFFPRITSGGATGRGSASFSFAQYRKNHEYQAAIGYAVLLIVFFVLWRWPLH
jgi:protein-S-isoprenylcysteine O-methyltransferase Ste14